MFKTTITRYPAFTDVDGNKISMTNAFDYSTVDIDKDYDPFDGFAKIKFDKYDSIGLFTNALIDAFKSASTMAIYADEKH